MIFKDSKERRGKKVAKLGMLRSRLPLWRTLFIRSRRENGSGTVQLAQVPSSSSRDPVAKVVGGWKRMSNSNPSQS